MKLRQLQDADAPLMLEWMHDPSVVSCLFTNFAEKTLSDCQRFIAYSKTCTDDLHLAIADDRDEYMGTVSLKHIDRIHSTAEFAITVRACAMGKGYSRFGMTEILKHALQELKLDAVYWCVDRINQRAVRFYDKHGYLRTDRVPGHILEQYPPADRANYIWYIVTEAL